MYIHALPFFGLDSLHLYLPFSLLSVQLGYSRSGKPCLQQLFFVEQK